MANNYTCFADEFRFPEEAAKDVLATVNGFAKREFSLVPQDVLDYMGFYGWLNQAKGEDSKREEKMFADFVEEQYPDLESINVSYENGKVYVASEISSAENFAYILSAIMDKHKIMEPVMLHEAWYCDKLRPNEFGGTAYAVGPGIVKAQDTVNLAERLADEIENELQEKPKP